MFKKHATPAFRRRFLGVWGFAPAQLALMKNKILKDDSLAVRDKVYSTPHIAILFLRKIKGSAYEKEVVLVLLFQAVIALGVVYSFYSS